MIEFLRYLTVACSVTAVVIGTPQWRRWLVDYPPEVVQGRLALAALNIAVGYGTFEVLARGIPGGPRTYLTAVGALWCLYTVAWRPVTHLHRTLTRKAHRDHAD